MKRHLMALVRGLVERGFEVEAACPGDSNLYDELMETGITVHPINIVGPISPREDMVCIRQLRKILSNGRYNIVHCHGSKAGMVGRIAAASVRCRNTVLTVHNFIIYREVPPVKKLVFRLGEKLLSGITSKIITVSSALKTDLVNNFRIPERKIVRVYNGIDIHKYLEIPDRQQARLKYCLDPDIPVVGTLARMAPQKGLEYLLKAVPSVCKHKEVKFLLAGDGPMMQQLKELAGALDISDNVIFTGYVDNVPEFFSCIDIFAVPSIAEGLSITTIEAMTAGLPVIASRSGGLPELVKHNETGLMVEPRDPQMLAEAINELLHNPVKRKTLGANGRTMASAHFSLDTMVSKTCGVYEEILQTVFSDKELQKYAH